MTRSFFECQPCDRQFASDEALQSHLQHSSRHFWCNPCNRLFNSEEALESHLSTAKAHTWCFTCNRGFMSPIALQSHIRNAVLHRYALANFTSPQKPNPQEPSPQKSSPAPAPQPKNCCDKCEISFKEPFQLREHKYSMHTERDIKQRDIKCWGCPKTFRTYSTLLAHLETETCITTRVGLDKLAVKCEYSKHFVLPGCEAHLRTGDRKNYISKAVFKKEFNRFGCSECDRFFANDAGLAAHIDSSAHHPLAYQCAGCASQHADLSSLLAHVEGSSCTEGVTYGTASTGKLLRYLWQNLRE